MRNDKGLVKKKELKLWKSFSPPTSQCDTQHLIDVGRRERKVVGEKERRNLMLEESVIVFWVLKSALKSSSKGPQTFEAV